MNLSSGLLPFTCLAFAACATCFAQPRAIRLEAEDGQLVGAVSRATTRPWYSGSGYITGFYHDGDKAVFDVPVKSGGFYDVRIRYCAPVDHKGYYLVVNGVKITGMFAITNEAFAEHSGGKIELNAGQNLIAIEKYWGHHDIDRIDLTPVPAPTIQPIKPPDKLCDPHATPKARELMHRLVEQYGKTTLSGVMGSADADYVRQVTGKTPAIMAGDLIEYSPSRVERGSDPKNETERLIKAAHDGCIITLCWHWNAPTGLIDRMITDDQGHQVDARWYKGFNANATTFDIAKALKDDDSEDYRLLLRDIDAIAVQLKKLADADVPVLWRPLHEAEGQWFWWGARGPQPFRKLWRLLYERLTVKHDLHNLIWVFTSYGGPGWYPGDDCVDIVGIDAYPADLRDPLSEIWELHQQQFAGRKLMAISEFGGVPDIERLRHFGQYWSYFVPWTGPVGPRKLNPDELRRILSSPFVTNANPPGAQ